jgi:hypothetical protein
VSVCSSVSTRVPLGGISWILILHAFTKICRENPIF